LVPSRLDTLHGCMAILTTYSDNQA